MKSACSMLAGQLAVVFLLVPGLALPLSASTDLENLPALVERTQFFDDSGISDARLSPDGLYLSFLQPWRGVRNIWIKAIDEPFAQARPLTANASPISGHFWSQDGQFVLYVQDRDGDENHQLWAVNPADRPDTQRGVPESRNLTDLGRVRANLIALPHPSADRILVGLNHRDPARHDVHSITLSTGERDLLIRNDGDIAGWTADLEGNIRLASRQTRDGGTEILSVTDGEPGQPVLRCGWEETCVPLRFLPDGQRVWLQSNRGDDVDLVGLYVFDLASGEIRLFERDPAQAADLDEVIFSPGNRVLATVYDDDRQRIYPQTDEFAAELDLLRRELPTGRIEFLSQSADGRLMLVRISADNNPGTVYLFNRKRQTVDKLYRSKPGLPLQAMVEMQPIRFIARDGLEIPAYLTVPQGLAPERLPLVVLVHGGPWTRDHWGFRADVQFLANRGYAVLQPNFRGSTGFGKAFLNAGNREWGDAMQNDITDGVEHLVEQGMVDPDRVCIMGSSWGGYAVLAGMTFTPATYACGISIAGFSNLIALHESLPPYWDPIRPLFIQRTGDPEAPEGRARLERQSPINHLWAIEKPLLIVHGANDPRVRTEQADRLIGALGKTDSTIEYLLAADEGHGFRGRKNRLIKFARIEAFLALHLGGRYQAETNDDPSVQH